MITTTFSWLLTATGGAIPIPLAGLHRMAPAKCLDIGQIAPGSRDPACLDQCAELEVDRIHLGRPAGKVAEAASTRPASSGTSAALTTPR